MKKTALFLSLAACTIPGISADSELTALKSEITALKSELASLKKEMKSMTKKNAFIQPSDIILKSEKWKDRETEVRTETEKRVTDLNKLDQKRLVMAKDLESMGNAVSKDARSKKEEEIAQLSSEIEIKYKSLQAYEQRMSQEAQMEIFKDMETAAKQVLDECDLDCITAGGIVAAKNDLDVTEKVLSKLNKSYASKKASTKVAKADTTITKTETKKSAAAA